MGDSFPRGLAILIDNSFSSIDGDFFPNRLDAQRHTIFLLADYTFQLNTSSQISIYTVGSREFGIRISFTSSTSKILESISTISCGGLIQLEKAIKSTILAFRYMDIKTNFKRIVCFIGNNHDLTLQSCNEIFNLLQDDEIIIDFFILGQNITNLDIIKNLSLKNKKSIFQILDPSDVVLSDCVLGSELGPGKEHSKVNLKDIYRANQMLGVELQQSLQKVQMENNLLDNNNNLDFSSPKKKTRNNQSKNSSIKKKSPSK